MLFNAVSAQVTSSDRNYFLKPNITTARRNISNYHSSTGRYLKKRSPRRVGTEIHSEKDGNHGVTNVDLIGRTAAPGASIASQTDYLRDKSVERIFAKVPIQRLEAGNARWKLITAALVLFP